MITFTVYGVPAPQGSMKAFMPRGGRFPILTADNARTKPWRHAVVAAARDVLNGRAPLEGAVEVTLTFYLPRPVSLPKRVVEPVKTRGSDLDKLERAILDALSAAGIWRDDAQAIAMVTRKAFAGGERDPLGTNGIARAEISVEAVS